LKQTNKQTHIQTIQDRQKTVSEMSLATSFS